MFSLRAKVIVTMHNKVMSYIVIIWVKSVKWLVNAMFNNSRVYAFIHDLKNYNFV